MKKIGQHLHIMQHANFIPISAIKYSVFKFSFAKIRKVSYIYISFRQLKFFGIAF